MLPVPLTDRASWREGAYPVYHTAANFDCKQFCPVAIFLILVPCYEDVRVAFAAAGELKAAWNRWPEWVARRIRGMDRQDAI